MALAEGDDACVGGHESEGFFAAGKGEVAAVEGARTGVFGGGDAEDGGVVGCGAQRREGGYGCGRVEGPDEVDGEGGGEDADGTGRGMGGVVNRKQQISGVAMDCEGCNIAAKEN